MYLMIVHRHFSKTIFSYSGKDSEAAALPAVSTGSKTSVNDDKVFIQNNATSTLDWISSEVEIVWESATDKDLPKQTASRDCFVKLHDIADLLAKGIAKLVFYCCF